MMKKTKYIWIKQGLDYYDNDAIDYLCGLENGGNYVVLYQRLCILAVKNGEEIITRHITDDTEAPYTLPQLARAIKCDLGTVTGGIPLLLRLNLLQMREDGAYFIPGLKKMVGRDSVRAKEQKMTKEKLEHKRELARLRQRRCRARKRIAALSSEKENQKQLNAPKASTPEMLVPNVPTQEQMGNNPYTGLRTGGIPVEILPPELPVTLGLRKTRRKK